ncbi:hypothetical protein CR513_08392, partial [Mucuna pruriens]
MTRFKNKFELVRHGVTRFATTFLTLQRLHKMFTLDEWVKSKAIKDPRGKKTTKFVLMPSFWHDVVYTLKVVEPIVRVLRLVDNEKILATSYIYDAMVRTRYAIQKAFNDNENKNPLSLLIEDEIANFTTICMQHFFYRNPNIEMNYEVLQDLYKCIVRLNENDAFVDHIHNELLIYESWRYVWYSYNSKEDDYNDSNIRES